MQGFTGAVTPLPNARSELAPKSADRRLGQRLVPLLQAAPFTALIIVVLVVPVAIFVAYSFRPSSTFLGVGSGFTLDHYSDVFHSTAAKTLLLRTVAIGLGVALATTVTAITVAYALTFRFRPAVARVMLATIVVTSVASLLVRIYAWGTILGTRGLINRSLETLGITDAPLGFLFFGYFAIVVTMLYVYLPLATLIVYSAMQNIDARTLEASRDLGIGRWRTVLRVVAPQASSGIVAAFALVTILVTADYVTPSLVGGVRGQTMGTLIRDTALGSGNYPAAAALSIVFGLFVITSLGVVLGGWRLSRRLRQGLAHGVDRVLLRIPRPSLPRGLQVSPIVAVAVLAYMTIPMIVVMVFSFNKGQTVGLPWRGFSTSAYGDIVGESGFHDAAIASAKLAVIAVIGGLVVGTPFAMMLARARSRWKQVAWFAVLAPFLVPGVLWGAAVVTASDDANLTLGIQTTAPVHVLLVTPVVVTVLFARLVELDVRLLEAARDLGSRPLRAWRTVTLPITLPSLAGAGLFAAAYSLDELFTTTFTIGSDSTIPVWMLSRARVGFSPGINALGVMLSLATFTVFAAAVTVLVRGTTRRRGGATQ